MVFEEGEFGDELQVRVRVCECAVDDYHRGGVLGVEESIPILWRVMIDNTDLFKTQYNI